VDKQQLSDWCESFTNVDEVRMPLIMGILNVTPNSFYDGGRYDTVDKAYDQAQALIAAGADIIDIGGESSRPGAIPLGLAEELDRVLPVIERLSRATSTSLSIDTYKPEVMRAGIEIGAACINDIFALQTPGALEVAAHYDVPICLMHMQGNPQSMQTNPQYEHELTTHVNDFFQQRIEACLAAGIQRKRLILDPGFGFGKHKHHNLQLVKHLKQLTHHRLPLLLGVSRKSTLGAILNQPPEGRLIGGIALSVFAMLEGVAILRTHDVLETRQACHTIQQLY
jgi:dihydropteroate synthase